MTFNLVTVKPIKGDVAGVYFVKNAETPTDNGIYVINVTGQAPIPMANPININDYLKNEDAEQTYIKINNPDFSGSIVIGDTELYIDENTFRIVLNEETLISSYIDPNDHSNDTIRYGDRSYANTELKGKNIILATGNPNGEGMGTGIVNVEAKELQLNGIPIPTSDLNGTNYVMVYGTGTDLENGIEFKNAYDSITSGTLIYAPGTYEFPTTFIHNKDNVNIVSLTGNRDGIFTVTTGSVALILSANNSLVKGIETNLMISVTQGLTGLVMEKLKGGDNSFNKSSLSAADTRLTYTAIDVEGGYYSFGSGDGANGFPNYIDALYNCTLIRCKGGEGAYAFNNTMFGCKLYDTEGLGYSYGCTDGERSSGIINCNFYRTIGGTDSYGANADADKKSGNYYYCIGGAGSAIASTTGVKLFCAVNNVAI